jgi:hypothetical protein
MTATEERKSCIDCEFFDTEAGNIYGVCVADSYIDADDEFHIEWIHAEAMPCNRFKEVQP